MDAAIATDALVVLRGGKPVVQGVSIEVRPAEITALVGANGAGKSTLVMAIAGILKPLCGAITFGGVSLIGRRPEQIRRMGIAIMPEGHQVLGGLTTLDNLRAAASMLSRSERDREIERALALFPELKARLSVTGRSLSGGQKQMLAISQALVARPKFLLIDELSFGLAPTVVKRLTGAIEKIAADGVGILLIEQFTTLALAMSRQSHVLERGRLVFSGSSRELQRHPEILHSAYFPT